MDIVPVLGLLGVALGCYTLYGAIYRLYLSLVASFPRAKLAVLTFWYEFYYDVVKEGQYTWKIAQFHDQSRPVVRINPFEIHINDPDFYDEVYVSPAKRMTKAWSWTVPIFGTPDSILATIDHDVHRRRRGGYSNYFSKQSIKRYSNVIQTSVEKIYARMREHAANGDPVNLVHAYSAFTGDVVTAYCFPESYNLLDKPDFSPEFSVMWKSILWNGHTLKQFPWLFPIMLRLPHWFVERFFPGLATTYQWQRVWTQQILDTKAETETSKDGSARASIFRSLLDSDLPPQDKSVSRLVEDAQTMVGAGFETTARTLAVGTYHILANCHIFNSLAKKRSAAIPDPTINPALADLERLPYSTAVRFEVLRISHSVSHRLQRVSPDQPYSDHNLTIPAGTPVSMTAALIQTNPDIFLRTKDIPA